MYLAINLSFTLYFRLLKVLRINAFWKCNLR